MKVYGPYTRKKDGRQIVIIYDHELNIRQTVSYPKYIAQQYLGYELKDNETVDHLDNNFLNNDPGNLRIINRSEHGADDALRLVVTIIPCVWCGTNVEVTGRNRTFNKAGPFCSRSCSGSYGRSVQLNLINRFGIFIPDKKYSRNKNSKELISIEKM